MYEPYKPYTVKDEKTGITYTSFPPLENRMYPPSGQSYNLLEEPIDKPNHYTWHPSGVEAKDIAQEFTYNIGTAIAYLWRHEYKNGIEDLKKAVKHIEFEIQRLEREANKHD